MNPSYVSGTTLSNPSRTLSINSKSSYPLSSTVAPTVSNPNGGIVHGYNHYLEWNNFE